MNNTIEKRTSAMDVCDFNVSIIIPIVHETENLFSSLVSVISQKMHETEIVIVDGSASRSVAYIVNYVSQGFADRIQYLQSSLGFAELCKLGLHSAHAPYVVFVEPDDLVGGDTSQNLYRKMIREDLDILFLRYIVFENDKKEGMIMPKTSLTDQEDVIRNYCASLWVAMYRKDLLLDMESDIFDGLVLEDDAAILPILMQTPKIGFCSNGLQYMRKCHHYPKRVRNCMTELEKDDFLAKGQMIVAKAPEALRMACEYRAVCRAITALNQYPEIYDYIAVHLHDLQGCIASESHDEKCFIEVADLPYHVLIPKLVYINGFMRDELQNFNLYEQEAAKAYLFHPQIVVLDEGNCDLHNLPQWLNNATNEEKGVYFAIKAISETGGIYLSPAVSMITSMNKEAFTEVFFVAGPNNSVLPCLFGAMPRQQIMHALLLVIEHATDAHTPLYAMLGRELIAQCGVHLNGEDESGIKGLHVLPFNSVCSLINAKNVYCMLNYSNLKTNMRDMYLLPQSYMQMAYNLSVSDVQNNSQAENELKKIKGSNAWKFITLLYKVRNKIRRKAKK